MGKIEIVYESDIGDEAKLMSAEPKAKRRRKYRTGVNAKNLKMFAVRVSAEVHDFFEIHSYDENGCKLSKGKVLERVIAIARSKMFLPPSR